MAVDALARAIAAGKVPVTAYEMAVKAGYTGTEEQFAEDMGNSGTNAADAAASASAAAASAASVSASAAQIATNTGDISDLKESLYYSNVIDTWRQGTRGEATGGYGSNSNSITTTKALSYANGEIKAYTKEGYKIFVYAWDSNGEYIGILKTDGTFQKTTVNTASVDEYSFVKYPDYTFQLTLRKVPTAPTTVEDSNNCLIIYSKMNSIENDIDNNAIMLKNMKDLVLNGKTELINKLEWKSGYYDTPAIGSEIIWRAGSAGRYTRGPSILPKGDYVYTGTNGYRIQMYYVDDNNILLGTIISSWQTGEHRFTIDDNKLYVISLAPPTSTATSFEEILENSSIIFTPESFATDKTLTKENKAADALEVGDNIRRIDGIIRNLTLESIFVNIKDFGAIGDGITDDTDAIQNALEAIKDKGGTVFVPTGTYLLNKNRFTTDMDGYTGSLTLYDNTTLYLDSGAVLLKGLSIDHLLFTYNSHEATGYSGAKNIKIIGGTIDGNKDNVKSNTLVNISHAFNITIENVTFTNAYGGWHYIEVNSSDNVKILNCIFGKGDNTGGNTEDIQIDAAIGAGNLGQNDGTTCQNIEISGCYFKNGEHPGIGNHSNAAHHNIKIHDNIFYNGGNRGAIAFVALTHSVDIFNNTFYNGTYGVNFGATQTDSLFANNRCESVTTPFLNCIGHNNIIDGVYTP